MRTYIDVYTIWQITIRVGQLQEAAKSKQPIMGSFKFAQIVYQIQYSPLK